MNRSRRRKEADSFLPPFCPPPYVGGYGRFMVRGMPSTFRSGPLTLCLAAFFILASVLCFGASPEAIRVESRAPVTEPSSDLVQFLDGGLLHGQLRSIDIKQGVEWQHPFARKAISFKPANLAWIKLENAKRISTQNKPTCWFQFNNGDELFGQLKSLDADRLEMETWFGGNLSAPRQALQSVTFFSKGFSMLYEGPTGIDGWKLDQGSRGWRYRDGGFVANSVGVLGRDLRLSGSSSIEFDLAWSGSFSLSFILYAEVIDRFDYSQSSYMFHLAPGYLHVQRVQAGAGVISLGAQAQLPEMFKKTRMHFETRFNKEDATITVLADGALIHRWKDHAGFVGKGSGAVFSSQMDGPTVKLSNIKVTEWDGAFEPLTGTNLISSEDMVFLANRDKVVGKLQGIREGKLSFTNPQATLDIPMGRVTRIVMAAPSTAAPEAKPWEIRVDVAGGGKVAFQLEKWNESQVSGKSANFGEMKIDPQSIRQIQFNPKQTLVSGEAANLTGEEFWDLDEVSH